MSIFYAENKTSQTITSENKMRSADTHRNTFSDSAGNNLNFVVVVIIDGGLRFDGSSAFLSTSRWGRVVSTSEQYS